MTYSKECSACHGSGERTRSGWVDGEYAHRKHAPCPCATDGRPRVGCDELCDAFKEPEGPEEICAAYEHWKCHGRDGGCSHGC